MTVSQHLGRYDAYDQLVSTQDVARTFLSCVRENIGTINSRLLHIDDAKLKVWVGNRARGVRNQKFE